MSSIRLRHPALISGSLGVLAVVVVVVIVVAACGGDGEGQSDYPFPVQTFEDLGREHLAPGQTYDFYNSDPPTTGPHAPAPADWGVHDQPVPKEVPIHNMEHGGVVIWYDCSAGDAPLDEAACQQLRDDLAGVTEATSAQGNLVLMVPYAGIEHRIALTAWRTLDGFDDFDGARVQAFIEAYDRRFNPEGF